MRAGSFEVQAAAVSSAYVQSIIPRSKGMSSAKRAQSSGDESAPCGVPARCFLFREVDWFTLQRKVLSLRNGHRSCTCVSGRIGRSLYSRPNSQKLSKAFATSSRTAAVSSWFKNPPATCSISRVVCWMVSCPGRKPLFIWNQVVYV